MEPFCSLSFAGRPLVERVSETILPNGLKVLLPENHKAPVITFQVWYRVGFRNEAWEKTGLSHMLEHMMFKGTKRFGPEQFSRTKAILVVMAALKEAGLAKGKTKE